MARQKGRLPTGPSIRQYQPPKVGLHGKHCAIHSSTARVVLEWSTDLSNFVTTAKPPAAAFFP